MRIIAAKTLKAYGEHYPQAKQALLSWHEEVKVADWNSPNELKMQYEMHQSLTVKGLYLMFMEILIDFLLM